MLDNAAGLAQAAYRLSKAQEDYDEALAEQDKLSSFAKGPVLFAVMAKVPDFQQFVAYSETGLLSAVFTDEDEANRYAATMKAPVGTMFVVEPVKSYI